MKNKKILIIGCIIVIAIITVSVLIINTIHPKHTSKELFVKASNDLIEFGLNLSESLTDMSNIMQNDLSKILDNENSTINLSKSIKFKNIKEKVEQNCNKIINYNNVGMSKEMEEYINYSKKIANNTLQYFNNIDKELSQDEFTRLLNEFSPTFSNDMNELSNLCTVASLAYYNEISDYKKTLEDFKNDIEESREKKSKNNSNTNTNNSKSSNFTNKYGTSMSLCMHIGCSNYIATTGDTNCCITHSRKCANCKKYIDEDALYCMDCLERAIKALR